jgi:hypothetical protein
VNCNCSLRGDRAGESSEDTLGINFRRLTKMVARLLRPIESLVSLYGVVVDLCKNRVTFGPT